MNEFSDKLGRFYIPDHLRKSIIEYTGSLDRGEFKPRSIDAQMPWSIEPDPGPNVWTVVKTLNSSSGNSIHTIERKFNELRCTCQSFKIQKTGSCKHTEAVKAELNIP